MKPLEILYRDDDYLVVDKPAGLVVIPTPLKEARTLTSIINQECLLNAAHDPQAAQGSWHPCHRLDRDTSGVVLYARGKKNQQLLMEQFARRAIKKSYLAFVHGQMQKPSGRIESFIRDAAAREHGQAGHWAKTEYHVVERRRDFTVVRIFLRTGRTNQIRIHFCDLGHPLLGERKYAFAKDHKVKFRRTALHAETIEWFHPIRRHSVKVKAPVPRDMSEFLLKQRS